MERFVLLFYFLHSYSLNLQYEHSNVCSFLFSMIHCGFFGAFVKLVIYDHVQIIFLSPLFWFASACMLFVYC